MSRTASTAGASSLDAVADQLYALPLEDFTAARNLQEKHARQAGDRDLATAIHALAKPSAAAWLVNQLVSAHRDDVEPLLELGADMREATKNLAGDQLREMSRQQHELIHALVQQTRALARDAGRTVSDNVAREVAETLHAVLADESAADEVLAGRLTESLRSSGFGINAATSSREPARRSSPRTAKQPDAELRRADLEVAAAEETLTAAIAARDAASAEADEAAQDEQGAEEQLEQLRRQLDEARDAVAQANRTRRTRATALRRTDKAADDAERRLADARRHRDELG